MVENSKELKKAINILIERCEKHNNDLYNIFNLPNEKLKIKNIIIETHYEIKNITIDKIIELLTYYSPIGNSLVNKNNGLYDLRLDKRNFYNNPALNVENIETEFAIVDIYIDIINDIILIFDNEDFELLKIIYYR